MLGVLIILIPAIVISLKYAAPSAAAWFDDSWLYRKTLVFNNSAQAGNLTDFPALVVLSSSNFTFSEAKTNGEDIRFTDSNGITLLPYEIETYDSVGLTARIWVKVPQINASSSTDSIYMYWGNAGAADAQSADNTWNSSYKGVYHLNNNAATTTVTDSSGLGNDITASENTNNSFAQTGKIGGSFLTAGTPTYITNQSGSNLQEIYPDIALDSNGYPVIAYFDNTTYDLVLVHCNDKECKGGDETVSTVDSTGTTGYYPSLRLDGNGYPMIAYYYASGADLKYVHCNDVNCAGGNESFSVIETTNSTGYYPRMVKDVSGYPVIAYYYGTGLDLKLVHCGNADCNSDNVINTVDSGGTVGNGLHGTDLVLDDAGFPVMSYYDTTNTELKVAHCNDVNCAGADESLTSPLSTLAKSLGSMTAIELDGSGLPMIAYYNAGDVNLEFIHCDDANCAGDESANRIVVSAAADNTAFPSMEKNNAGLPMIVAGRGQAYLAVYACANTNCSTNTRTDLTLYNQYGASYPNFKLDANNNLYVIAYSRGKTGDYDTYLVTTQHKLERAYDSDFDFGTGSFSISAWFKSTGMVQKNYLLSRYNADKGYKIGFNYAGRACFEIDDDSSWGPDDSACSSDSQISTNVDNGNGGSINWNSMVLDTSGFPVIAYFDNSGYNLELIHCNDANCTGNNESYASVESTNDVGRTPSIVLDSAGFPVIAYHDNTNNDLRVVHCGNANCTSGNTINTIDGADDVGDYPTVKLDSVLGYPVIAYFDTTNTAVKLVRCNDVNCSGGDENIVTLVNDEDDRVRHGSESLQLDASGYPMVVYTDITNYDLKYIHCNDVNCDGVGETKVNIDSGGTVGDFASMVLDSSGYPVIAYMDGSNIDLKLVHCGNSNCNSGNVINTVSSITGGDAGYYNINVKLNSLGNPVILHTQLASWSTILTVCNDVNCSGNDETSSRIRGDTYNYVYHSLAVDTSGYPVVSFANSGWDLNLLHLNNVTTYTSTGNYDDNAWHHLVAVKNGTSSITTYIDGVSVGSDVALAASGTLTSSTATLNLAEDLANSLALNNWTGYLDEVQIDNTARSAAWVAAEYLSESNNFINTGITENGPTAVSMGSYTGDTGALKNNLVGYWKFDEGQGATTYDSSPTGLNGTLSIAATGYQTTIAQARLNGIDGKFNKGINFDGVDDQLNMGYNSALNLPSDFTVSFWVNNRKALGTTDPKFLLYHEVYLTSGFRTWITTNNYFQFTTNQSGGTVSVTSNTQLQQNQWYHLSITYSGTTATLYINGKRDNYGTGTYVPSAANYYLAGMGDARYYLDAMVDEVKIYNAALTADEVKMDYNRGSAMVLGSLSDTSLLSGGSVASNSATAAYCVPGSSDSCSSPVGEWNFEEKTGTNAYDTSGNGNTGTISNPAWTPGKFGSALATKQDSNIQQVATITDPASGILDFSNTQDFTTEVWVKSTGNESWIIPLNKGASTASLAGYDIEIHPTTNKTNCNYGDGDGSGSDNTQSTTNVKDGKWHLITCVMDRNGSEVGTAGYHVFIDGRLEGSDTSLTEGSAAGSTQNLLLGEFSTGYEFNGAVDQARIFNYARTPAQIAWDYNRGGPVGQWKFDECQGTVANDSSGNGNTGTISIGATGTNTSAGTCTTSGAWFDGATGKYNSSLEFDLLDDLVTANVSGLSTQYVSVSAWIKANSFINFNNFVNHNWIGNGWTMFATNANKIYFGVGQGGTQYNISTDALNTGAWYHVTGVYDGSNVKIYLNGQFVRQTALSNATLDASASNVKIGQYSDSQIDDVRVYNYALTPTQIKQVYNNGAVNFGPVTGSP